MTIDVGAFIAHEMELVSLRGESLLAYPRGRHQALRARPPRVSVCVPVWQGGAALGGALESLTAQTYRDFAVVVVDNNSQDSSFRVACQFARHHDNVIVYQNPRNVGRVPNWNRCLDLSFGDYVKLLFVHDRLHPGFLQRLVAAADSDPDVAVACAAVETLRDGRRVVAPPFAHSRAMTGAGALVRSLGGDNPAGPPCGQLWRRAPFEKPGVRFRTDLSWGAAFELSLRLYCHGDYLFVHEPLATFDDEIARTHNGSSARLCFHDEAEARLQILRDAGLPMPADTIRRTLHRVLQLHDVFQSRAEEEGQEGELSRDCAAAVMGFADLYQRVANSVPPGRPRADGQPADDLRRLLVEAENEVRAQRYQEAEAQLRHILSLSPYFLPALKDLGIVRYHQDDLWGARKYLLSALDIDPGYDLAPREILTRAPAPRA